MSRNKFAERLNIHYLLIQSTLTEIFSMIEFRCNFAEISNSLVVKGVTLEIKKWLALDIDLNRFAIGWIIFLCLQYFFPQNSTNADDEQQQNEVYLPSTGSDPASDTETEPIVNQDPQPEEGAYPESEQEVQDSNVADVPQGEAYPEPEQDSVQEPTSTPEVEPTQGPKPTSRGAELHASSPARFSLASGKVQLVELFAFW